MKRSLEGVVVGIPLIYDCGKNPVSYELEDILIDKRVVADAFGNHDRTASEDELIFIDDYLKSNPELWALGGFPGDYQDKNEIPLSEIINAIKNVKLYGPFKSEAELRKSYEGTSIKTPRVGIYVFDKFVQDGKRSMYIDPYRITRFYEAHGPNVSGGEWTPIIINKYE